MLAHRKKQGIVCMRPCACICTHARACTHTQHTPVHIVHKHTHARMHTHQLLLWTHSFTVNYLSNSVAFSLGSILVASGPSVYQLPMLHVADERTQHSQEYHHEEQFHVGSPEEAISPNTTSETQARLSYPLEVHNIINIIWWNLCDNIVFRG